MNNQHVDIEQKILNPMNGVLMLLILIALCIFSVLGFIVGIINGMIGLILLCVLLWIVLPFMFAGLRSVRPNEALVLTLFGKYHGTINKPGYFFVNPFARYNNPAYEARVAAEAAEISEDELKTSEEKVQKMTDKFIKEVDKAIDAKSNEILTI